MAPRWRAGSPHFSGRSDNPQTTQGGGGPVCLETPSGGSPRKIGSPDRRLRGRLGAGGRTRTDTLSPEPDFESGASTNSATPARLEGEPKYRPGRPGVKHERRHPPRPSARAPGSSRQARGRRPGSRSPSAAARALRGRVTRRRVTSGARGATNAPTSTSPRQRPRAILSKNLIKRSAHAPPPL